MMDRPGPRRRVATVLGPRALPDGALIDAHGHVWISPPAGAPENAPVLDREQEIAAELAVFADAGGSAVVDCQPPGAGRDARRLVRLAEASGVAIVAATGFHLRPYHGAGESVWTASADAARERFLAELRDGMVEDGERLRARAGIVKVAHPGAMDAGTERLLSAAAAAAAAAGVLLVVHTERGAGVEGLVDFLGDLDVSSRDVMLCHIDKRPDLQLHQELARAGFLLEYDTFLRPQYAPEERAWPLVGAMLAHGHERSIACGLDLADHPMWRFGGHPVGMVGLRDVVLAGLQARGASARQVELLTGGNVAARLRGTPVAEAVA
jgi:phosphotriesterase-related protein